MSDIGVFGVTFDVMLSSDHREKEDEASELMDSDLARLTCQSWIAEAKRLPRPALSCLSSSASHTGRPLTWTVGVVHVGSALSELNSHVGSEDTRGDVLHKVVLFFTNTDFFHHMYRHMRRPQQRQSRKIVRMLPVCRLQETLRRTSSATNGERERLAYLEDH